MFMLVIMVMVVMTFFFLKKSFKLVVKSIFLRHSVNKLLTAELIPLCCNNRSNGVEFLYTADAVVNLLCGKTGSMTEDKTACISYLIVEKFAEIFLVHLAFFCVNNSCKPVELNIVSVDILNSTDNVAELSNAGRLDKNTVGGVILKNLFKSLSEISDKTTADTAGIHFGYFNACVLKKSAVDTDIAEFVFNKHKLFVFIAFSDKLFDKSSFSGTKKSGKNCNFSHTEHFLFKIKTVYLILYHVCYANVKRLKNFS